MGFSWFVDTTDIRILRSCIAVVNTRSALDDKLTGERRSAAEQESALEQRQILEHHDVGDAASPI